MRAAAAYDASGSPEVRASASPQAVAAAASAFGTMFGVSSLGTVSLEELRRAHATPQVYQFYFHKDRGLNRAMMQRAKEARIDVMMLTVDSITGGNRERDLRTGFSIPFRLTPAALVQFAIKPAWGLNYLLHERFSMPQLDAHVDFGHDALSIGRYFTDMLDPSIAPGTGTRVPGGIDYREAQLIMEMIADTGRMGSLDLVEVNPALDKRNATARLAVDLVESLFGKSTLMRD